MEQDPNTQLWLVASLAFVIGLAAGVLLCYLLRPGRAKGAAAELERLQLEFQGYRDQVNDHFSSSAHLIHKMSDAYQALQEHMASSAGSLCDDNMTQSRLQSAPAEDSPSPLAPPQQAQSTPMAPPRDYAERRIDEPGELASRLQEQEPVEPKAEESPLPRTPI